MNQFLIFKSSDNLNNKKFTIWCDKLFYEFKKKKKKKKKCIITKLSLIIHCTYEINSF